MASFWDYLANVNQSTDNSANVIAFIKETFKENLHVLCIEATYKSADENEFDSKARNVLIDKTCII